MFFSSCFGREPLGISDIDLLNCRLFFLLVSQQCEDTEGNKVQISQPSQWRVLNFSSCSTNDQPPDKMVIASFKQAG